MVDVALVAVAFATVGAKVAFVGANVLAFFLGVGSVAVPHILAEFAAILAQVTLITVDVALITIAVAAVLPDVAAVAYAIQAIVPQVAPIFPRGVLRVCHCAYHQHCNSEYQ
jgi:hypothetical protein